MVSVTPWPLFTPGKDPVPIVQEAEWAPGLVWTSAKNLVRTGIRSPDRPARSQSLYRLLYPAHSGIAVLSKFAFHPPRALKQEFDLRLKLYTYCAENTLRHFYKNQLLMLFIEIITVYIFHAECSRLFCIILKINSDF